MRFQRRLSRWVYSRGIKAYCHRCDEIMWIWRKCPHRPRWLMP